MTNEPFVTSKTIRFKQKHVDKYKESGIGDFSKFVRKAIEAYDVNFELMKMEAKAEAYNECITKMTVERDFVLHVLQNQSTVVTQTLQNDVKNQSVVRQSLQEPSENNTNVIQNNENENLVLQNELQTEQETTSFVTQMELDPNYEKIKPYLHLLSRQLNTIHEVPDATKKKISDEQSIQKAKINSFIYEFQNEIKSVDFEIPDNTDRSVEKHYNRLMGKFV